MISLKQKTQAGITALNEFASRLTQPVQLVNSTITIPSGGTAVVASLTGPGYITQIKPVQSGLVQFSASATIDSVAFADASTIQQTYQRDDGVDSAGGIECFIAFEQSASVMITNNDPSAADYQVVYAV